MGKATHDEIRKALGHGRGNRRVYIGPDGRVLFYGSIYREKHADDFWREARHVDEYLVFDGVAGVVIR